MRKIIKTDSDLVRIAQQIDYHLDVIRGLVQDLEQAEHSGASHFVVGLEENGLTAFAWARHIVSHSLLFPERWETGDFGIRYKRGRKPGEIWARKKREE